MAEKTAIELAWCEICGEFPGVTNAETEDGEPGMWVCAMCAQGVANELEWERRERSRNYGPLPEEE